MSHESPPVVTHFIDQQQDNSCKSFCVWIWCWWVFAQLRQITHHPLTMDSSTRDWLAGVLQCNRQNGAGDVHQQTKTPREAMCLNCPKFCCRWISLEGRSEPRNMPKGSLAGSMQSSLSRT